MPNTKREILRDIFYILSKWSYPVVSNEIFNNSLFFYNCMRLDKPFYWQKLRDPKTFNEKISWLKFNCRHPLAPVVADKLRVKDYVSKKIGSQYIIPTLKKFDDPQDMAIDDLPSQFILKLNTGSGQNLICTDKAKFDRSKAIAFFRNAFRRNPFYLSREWHYRLIKPLIIAEPLIGENIADYKFFCRKGEPLLIQVDTNRFSGHKRNFFDIDWNPHSLEINYAQRNPNEVQRPKMLNKMMELAHMLSSDFLFIRVDLYDVDGQVYFGELTLHPGGGVEPFASREQDLQMGKFLDLSGCVVK